MFDKNSVHFPSSMAAITNRLAVSLPVALLNMKPRPWRLPYDLRIARDIQLLNDDDALRPTHFLRVGFFFDGLVEKHNALFFIRYFLQKLQDWEMAWGKNLDAVSLQWKPVNPAYNIFHAQISGADDATLIEHVEAAFQAIYLDIAATAPVEVRVELSLERNWSQTQEISHVRCLSIGHDRTPGMVFVF